MQVHFSLASQFYVRRKCGIIYTRFHTFHVHINVEFYIHAFISLYGGENRYGKIFTVIFDKCMINSALL